MTLDETIKREEKIEKQQMERANALDDIPLFGMDEDDKKQIEECYKCAEEHRQLAEWLKDYKRLLEQEPYNFAIWVAREIFDENWEYNKEDFAEIACRKLAKLGIVMRMGDEWELVESLERSGEE